jgi:hypothetical protein
MPARRKRTPPQAGSSYTRKYKGRSYTLRVMETDGVVAYKLGGQVFSSPSSAAKSITGGEINGWAFWHIDT